MKAVIQRVSQASVSVNGETVGHIGQGLLVLLGVHVADTESDADYLIRKISHLRIFEDEQGKMNRTLQEANGSILSVSQFTLYAETKKGNRPSFIQAARPQEAKYFYEYVNAAWQRQGISVATGIFGSEMAVSLTNQGPVTIVLDTKKAD